MTRAVHVSRPFFTLDSFLLGWAMKGFLYVRTCKADNEYAHPLDLCPLVDLNLGKVRGKGRKKEVCGRGRSVRHRDKCEREGKVRQRRRKCVGLSCRQKCGVVAPACQV